MSTATAIDACLMTLCREACQNNFVVVDVSGSASCFKAGRALSALRGSSCEITGLERSTAHSTIFSFFIYFKGSHWRRGVTDISIREKDVRVELKILGSQNQRLFRHTVDVGRKSGALGNGQCFYKC